MRFFFVQVWFYPNTESIFMHQLMSSVAVIIKQFVLSMGRPPIWERGGA